MTYGTRASMWLGYGADLKVGQRVIGHASAARTMDLYGHLIDRNLRAAAARGRLEMPNMQSKFLVFSETR